MSYSATPADSRVRLWRARRLTCIDNNNPTQSFAPLTALKPRLTAIRDALGAGLIERDLPLRLALLAAITGEHLLLIGPPGTAKSELARRLRLAFRDASYFERLLTRFSVPEELFGPLSIKALEEDRYVRQVDGYLPTASVAFIDEVFKANSAILNTLLTLLNEREFDNGCQRLKSPLLCVVAASNELPEGPELAALYDRFLLRCFVPPVSEEGFEQLLAMDGERGPELPSDLALTTGEMDEIRQEAAQVTVPAEVTSLLKGLRRYLADQHIEVSDRRWRKIASLLRAVAYTDGRREVSLWDCWLLQHCVWSEPEHREGIEAWLRGRLGAGGGVEPERFARLIDTWETTLRDDRQTREAAAAAAETPEPAPEPELEPEPDFDPMAKLLPSAVPQPTLTSSQLLEQLRAATSPTNEVDAPEHSPAQEATAAAMPYRPSSLGPKLEPRFLPPPDCRGRAEYSRSYTRDELEQQFFDRWERAVGDRYYFDNQQGTLYLERYVADMANLAPLQAPTTAPEDPHLLARLDATGQLVDDLRTGVSRIDAQLAALPELEGHLWLPEGTSDRMVCLLEETRQKLQGLQTRAEAVHMAYLDLGRE